MITVFYLPAWFMELYIFSSNFLECGNWSTIASSNGIVLWNNQWKITIEFEPYVRTWIAETPVDIVQAHVAVHRIARRGHSHPFKIEQHLLIRVARRRRNGKGIADTSIKLGVVQVRLLRILAEGWRLMVCKLLKSSSCLVNISQLTKYYVIYTFEPPTE